MENLYTSLEELKSLVYKTATAREIGMIEKAIDGDYLWQEEKERINLLSLQYLYTKLL